MQTKKPRPVGGNYQAGLSCPVVLSLRLSSRAAPGHFVQVLALVDHLNDAAARGSTSTVWPFTTV